MQLPVIPPRSAGDGGLHRQEGVVRIDGTERADFLHVVRAAAGDRTGREKASERLEPAQSLITELSDQRARIQIEPGRLNIHADAELGAFFHGLFAHEIGMGDAGAIVADRPRAIQLLIDIQQRVHCAIAHGMRSELHSMVEGRLDDLEQALFGDKQHAAIFRIANGVNLADAPGLSHVRTAGQHAAVEKCLDADDLQHRVALPQRIVGHGANAILDSFHRADGVDVARDGNADAQPAVGQHFLISLHIIRSRIAIADAGDSHRVVVVK